MEMEESKLHFQKIHDPENLLSIVKERLPHSCYTYNQILIHRSFKEDLKFYALVGEDNDINSNTWIVVIHLREDFGDTAFICAPIQVITGVDPVPKEVKECFINTEVLKWGETFNGALAKPVSAMIREINTDIMGNITEVHPCILYYMETNDALNLEIRSPVEGDIRQLDVEKDTDFILNTWKYSLPGSEKVIEKSILNNASAGVFINDKCVSGVIVPGNGIVGSLYTLSDFRGKGFAKLVMKFAFKEFAKRGCIPCLTVEVTNERSIQFHESLGVKAVSFVDGMLVKPLDISD